MIQWTSEVPTKDGNYWLVYFNPYTRAMTKPQVVQLYNMDGKGNIVLGYGRTPKLAAFVKKIPTALWCEVIPPPPIPATNGDTK